MASPSPGPDKGTHEYATVADWLTEQALGVTIVGGVVAALVAAGIIALVTLLVR